MWNPSIKFFNESKTLYIYDGRLLISIFLTFLQSLAQLHDDPIRLWLWFGHHQLHLTDLNVAHLWVENPQNGMYQTNFLAACAVLSFTEIKKQNMTKMLIFTLHLKVDAKLTTVNENTGNLFVKQAQSDR